MIPAFAGVPVGPAVRKGDAPLLQALRRAVADIYADGTMSRILAKWQLPQLALPDAQRQEG